MPAKRWGHREEQAGDPSTAASPSPRHPVLPPPWLGGHNHSRTLGMSQPSLRPHPAPSVRATLLGPASPGDAGGQVCSSGTRLLCKSQLPPAPRLPAQQRGCSAPTGCSPACTACSASMGSPAAGQSWGGLASSSVLPSLPLLPSLPCIPAARVSPKGWIPLPRFQSSRCHTLCRALPAPAAPTAEPQGAAAAGVHPSAHSTLLGVGGVQPAPHCVTSLQ